LRAQAAAIRQRLYVDPSGWWGTTENLDALPVVQDAVSRDRKLAIQYRGAKGEDAERTIDPLGLVAKGAVWYLVAQTPAGLRTYRVSRIKEATLLESASARPLNFDLAAYWKSSTAQFMESRTRYSATLRLEPRAADKVRAWRMSAPVETEQGPDAGFDADGWTTLRLQFEDEEQACFVALGFGPGAEVVEPESLRRRVADDLDKMVARRTWVP
jgi:predicted DNA-binding transcriptional regulator YafY